MHSGDFVAMAGRSQIHDSTAQNFKEPYRTCEREPIRRPSSSALRSEVILTERERGEGRTDSSRERLCGDRRAAAGGTEEEV